MKKVIYVNDLCCQRCADQMAVKIALLDGVDKAKADFKKNRIFVEVRERVSDEDLHRVFEGTGMEVLSIELRKGILVNGKNLLYKCKKIRYNSNN